MGLLRLWLALAVVAEHISSVGGAVGAYRMLPAQLAVQCFYVISGFYMALVLDKKYAQSKWIFFFNRITRLYPAYLALLAIAACFYWGSAAWLGKVHMNFYSLTFLWPRLSPAGRFYTAFSNLVIEGKDLALFLAVDPRTARYYFDPDALHKVVSVQTLQLIPQAWTLGLEFNFYLLSPWLLQLRSRWLFLILGLSTGVRLALAAHGFTEIPWNYGFFPSELAVFLAGALAYRLYKAMAEAGRAQHPATHAATLALIPVLVLSRWLPLGAYGRTGLTLPLLALALPWIFARSKDRASDRAIGELSYTVYLSHFLVADCLYVFGWAKGQWGIVEVMATTILFSLLIRHAVEKPADRWRHRLTETWMKNEGQKTLDHQ
jgi:peptidoglycan/LPS O-acetylase OafA/YrhL